MSDGDELSQSRYVGPQTHQDATSGQDRHPSDVVNVAIMMEPMSKHVWQKVASRRVNELNPKQTRVHVLGGLTLLMGSFYRCLWSVFHPETETFSCMSHLTLTPNRFVAEWALLYVTITHDCCVTGLTGRTGRSALSEHLKGCYTSGDVQADITGRTTPKHPRTLLSFNRIKYLRVMGVLTYEL